MNAAAVSRALGRAGFDRFEADTTSVRGYYYYSPGYRVMGSKAAWEEGFTDDPRGAAVFVRHESLSSQYGEVDAKTPSEYLSDYREVLVGAGYDASIDDRRVCLRVTR